MESIKEMIARMCPEGVKTVYLADCANVLYGYPFESELFTEEPEYIPLIRIRDVLPGKASTYYTGNYSSEYVIHKGDILVGMDGNFNLSKWNDRDGLLNQRVCKISCISTTSENGYLYHILGPIFKTIELNTSGGSVKHLSAKTINQIQIPLPPLSIQQEIVRILDTFTSLQSNLEAELLARQKQYEHYRNELLTFDKNDKSVEWKSLEEIMRIKAGGDVPEGTIKGQSYPTDLCPYPVYSNGKEDLALYGYSPSFKNLKESITVSARGSIGYHTVRKGKFTPIVRLITMEPIYDDNIYYINYALYNVKILGSQGSIPQLTVPMIKEICIPLPSKERQQDIVNILDTFEATISNLKQEIEARKKQYEYYREQLLTFN